MDKKKGEGGNFDVSIGAYDGAAGQVFFVFFCTVNTGRY